MIPTDQQYNYLSSIPPRMSSDRKMDMRNFFRSVKRKEVHRANMQIENFRDEDKGVADAERRNLLNLQIEARNEIRRSDANKRRAEARRLAASTDLRSATEIVEDVIDAVVEETPRVIHAVRETVKRHKRPDNWEDIAYEAVVYGNSAAAKNYSDLFLGASDTAVYQRLNQWKNDVKNKKAFGASTSVRLPSYGAEIDAKLLADFHTARSIGLPVDDVILRRNLVVRLHSAGKEGLLVENGGKFSYMHSWANRFYKRHNLVLRVCTTKMRELPEDFEEKKAKYVKIGSELIFRHNVPPELVINGDETSVQLVNRARVTRNDVGAKRVKVLGMGEDKAQITATLLVTEHGEVLPYQMIFTGTTDRCHPKGGKPDDCLWTHTSSHWQSVQTYLE